MKAAVFWISVGVAIHLLLSGTFTQRDLVEESGWSVKILVNKSQDKPLIATHDEKHHTFSFNDEETAEMFFEWLEQGFVWAERSVHIIKKRRK